MDKKLMAQLGIRPIVKRKTIQSKDLKDVRMYANTQHTTDNGNIVRSRINIRIRDSVFEKNFKCDYLSFGYAKEANRLYFWKSDSANGFKMSHSDNKSVAESGYYAQSTDLFAALEDIIKVGSLYYFDLKYSKDIGLYYISLAEEDMEVK